MTRQLSHSTTRHNALSSLTRLVTLGELLGRGPPPRGAGTSQRRAR